MIEKAEFYGVSCDRCGKLHVNFHEHAWFGDATSAKEEALEDGRCLLSEESGYDLMMAEDKQEE